ncbi:MULTISPECIES: DUF2771 family protein [Gordonia]|uniref:DUF2771 family protein n=1 Tax=Gordonia amicalis TaxID=89053 RepID=A0AAE4U776_9ACTN|nr:MULTISPECIES: DUF2771 family protein [Gordonia]ATD69882.1 DUF2771 domain-containing protein [Gordonia sp. 1D]KAF0967869.1 hypothetical protein BPODLACK_03581 [Gordonia sp. YY1]MCR8898557.1 DUF2771 domain-containing protein [Gordonia sp. GONU]MCZ4581429.1 DUF2771 family protein [Gordonia amicalis]MDJ0455028.1 DUF2771 family protein [Gordonia amicalis]
MISSGEKKALAIIAIVVVAFVAVVGTSVFLLTRNSTHDDKPYLHIAVGKNLYTVEPVRWCDLMLDECDPPLGTSQREAPRVPVAVGDTVMLSVSGDISQGPWNLAAVYWTPRGLVEDEQPQASGETYTVTLKTAPEYVLLGITVYPASARLTRNDEIIPRGVLAAETAPQEFQKYLG